MSFLGVLEAIGKDFAKGLGQPGRLHEIEGRLVSTERAMQRMKGIVAALGPLLAVVHLVISYFTGKHS